MDEQDDNQDEEDKISVNEFEYEKSEWRIRTVCLVLLFVVIAIVITSIITYNVIIRSSTYSEFYESSSDLPTDEETVLASDTISDISALLTSFADFIDQKYIGDIDRTELINSTIKGFVSGIGDEYSEFMTAEEWEDYQESALGNYVGIGVYMSMDDDDNATIIQVIKGSPAEEAGLQAEDIITSVDDESTSGMTLDDVSNKIKGEAGTDVDVTIYRNGEYIDYTLTRNDIKIYHVEYEMKEDNIGYIELYTFDDGCAEEFETAMDDLIASGAQKIVFDLRYNTGGLVEEALSIIDLFVDKGATELIEVSSGNVETIHEAENEKKYDVDMVILTNEYTASASEIVTGALMDNDIAVSVGTVTYGKGVIQNVYPLTTGGVLKLTTAEYYTPNRNKINKVGITPDYEVELETEENEDGTDEVIDTQLDKAIELLKI